MNAKKKTTIKAIRDDYLKVIYKEKEYNLNISEELKIDPNTINSLLQDSPANYAFLCLLRDEQNALRLKLEQEVEFTYAQIWAFYKESSAKTTNEMARSKTLVNPKYNKALNKCQEITNLYNKLCSICKAYESRERIMQTLSANIRKQQ